VSELDAFTRHPDPRVRNYAMIGVWLIRALKWGLATGVLGWLGGLVSFRLACPREELWVIIPWAVGFALGGGLIGAGLPLVFAAWHFVLHVLAEALDVLKGK